jgi:glycosyltransferase involved in cell wall biosynthesis
MKVTMAMASISRNAGGLFPAARRLAQELHQLPNTVVGVVGLRDEFSVEDGVAWHPIPIQLCAPQGPKILGWSGDYARSLRAQAPDIVHQHGIWTLLALETTRFRRRHGKLVVSLHGMIEPWSLKNSKVKKRLAWFGYQRQNLEQADCLIVSSEPEVGYVRDLGIQTPIAVVPNGVDAAAPFQSGVAWPFSIPEGRRVVLFLGRLHPKKGLTELLRGFAQALELEPKRKEQWSLVLTGWDDGGYEATLRALAEELHLEAPMLHFTGPLFGAARDAALRHASVFILPSLGEGMPMAALEALAAGLPVLLTDACNLTPVFDANAGLRIAASEAGVLQGLCQFFKLSDSERAEMGARARQLAEERFSWPRIAVDVGRVYAFLLGQGDRPDALLR